MTIVDAIKLVLINTPEGLTANKIYDEIIKKELYSFGAKNPLAVVNSQQKNIKLIDGELLAELLVLN